MYSLKKIPIYVWCFFGLLFAVPFISPSPYTLGIFARASVFAIWAMSWDIFSGYTGQTNFGHAAFIGTAGFISGIMNTRSGISPLYTILMSGVMMSVFAFFLGTITLRIKGHYFAIVTLAVNIIFSQLALVFWRWTGAEEGIPGLDRLIEGPLGNFYFSISFCFVVFLILMAIVLSKYGKILIAIRENDNVAEFSGINTMFYRISAFTLSGLLFGLSGAIFAHMNRHAAIEQIELFLSATILIMAIFGGRGTIIGPLFGAFLMVLLGESFRFIEQHRMLFYFGIIFFTIIIMPQGFFPTIRVLLANVPQNLHERRSR